ncbi:MAG: flagellar export chaperone FlgN [Tepidisphaeraceae bacterium]|jgi:hypothetical protein
MSRQLTDLLSVLAQMIAEQHKLLHHMESQHVAMKTLDLNSMNELISAQEAIRLRLTMLDNRRKILVKQLAEAARVKEEPTVTKLAEMFPGHATALLKSRDDLRDVIGKISARSKSTSKLAAAVLGHLNTVGRLIAGAVQRAGLYTKQGVRQMNGRIGVMEAVG